MLSYTKLSGNARRFKTIMGMSLQEFDLLLAKVEKTHPEAERDRLSKRPRKRAIGAGRRFAPDPRSRVMLPPFHYGTYATQDVAAEVFGVGPGHGIALHRPDRPRGQAVHPGTSKDPRQGKEGLCH